MLGREVVVLEAVRTPIGRRNGVLSAIHPVDLVGRLMEEALDRSAVEPNRVDDVIMGCVDQVGEQSLNVARSAALAAGLPTTVPGVTIDRQCGSSQQAVHFAAQAVAAGAQDIVVAAGVESMSRVPMYSNFTASSEPYGDAVRERLSLREDQFLHQAPGAELLADRWGLTRQDLDAFALQSQQRAAVATKNGHFDREIVPVHRSDGAIILQDEGIRPDTSAASLARLQPAFTEEGRLTAGNSSQISDGAAVTVIAARDVAEKLGLPVRARIVEVAVVGSDPVVMVDGPMAATRRVLERSGLSLSDIDLFEVNEAFACVPLAWMQDLGVDDSCVNVNGGAVALGHPLGATGARLFATMLTNLEQFDAAKGLITVCEGGGMANATIIERMR